MVCIAETAKLSHTIRYFLLHRLLPLLDTKLALASVLVLTASLVTTMHLAIDMYYFFIVGRLYGVSVFVLFFAEFCLWMVVDLSEAMDLGFLNQPKGWFSTDGPFPKCGFGHNRSNSRLCDLMRARFFISLVIL